jgi:hypothetical protein
MNKKIVFALSFFLTTLCGTLDAISQWEPIGPVAKHTYGTMFATGSYVFYYSEYDAWGLFRSSDYGRSWHRQSLEMPYSFTVGTNGRQIVVGASDNSGPQSFFYSDDQGDSWTKNVSSEIYPINSLWVNQSNFGVQLFNYGDYSGYLSTDGRPHDVSFDLGAHWDTTNFNDSQTNLGSFVGMAELTGRFGSRSLLCAAFNSTGLFFSSDDGRNWIHTLPFGSVGNDPLTYFGITTSGNKMYTASTGGIQYMCRDIDTVYSWHMPPGGSKTLPAYTFVHYFKCIGNDRFVIILNAVDSANSTRVLYSEDGCSNWTDISSGLPSYFNITPAINSNAIIITSGEDRYFSNFHQPFSKIDIRNPELYEMTGEIATDASDIFCISDLWSQNEGTSWTDILDTAQHNTQYFGTFLFKNVAFITDPDSIRRIHADNSIDALPYPEELFPLNASYGATLFKDSSSLYYSYNKSLFRSGDLGVSWQPYSLDQEYPNIRKICGCEEARALIYAGGVATLINGRMQFGQKFNPFELIQKGSNLYLVDFGRVFFSSDFGQTWDLTFNRLESNCHIVKLASHGNHVFAYSIIGHHIFHSHLGKNDWSEISKPIDSSHVHDFGITDNFLILSGREGLFRLPLSSFSSRPIEFSADLFFCGTTQGRTDSKSIKLTNTTDSSIIIYSMTSSDSSFTFDTTGFPLTILPGQTLDINLLFRPDSLGVHTTKIVIKTSATEDSISVVGVGSSNAKVRAGNADSKDRLTAWPNPSNRYTTITFEQLTTSPTQISIVNLLGSEVCKLHSGMLSSDIHSFTWDTDNYPSGTYQCIVRTATASFRVPISVYK